MDNVKILAAKDAVYIEIKIPAPLVCPCCQKKYEYVVDVVEIERGLRGSTLGTQTSFKLKDQREWQWVYDLPDLKRRTKRVCPDCAAPINDAEFSAEQIKSQAMLFVGKKLWPEKG